MSKPIPSTGALQLAIEERIRGSMEDTSVTDAIAQYADKRVGKALTKLDLPHITARLADPAGIRLWIVKEHGTSKIAWRRGNDRDWYTVTIARSETGVRWPTSNELRNLNPSTYLAATRNSARHLALLNGARTAHGAQLMQDLIRARAAFEAFLDADESDAIRWNLTETLKAHGGDS